MWKFILRRFLVMIPQLFLLSVIVFALAKQMPGDALTGVSMDPRISPERLYELREKAGLNDPWYEQYRRWISGIAQGDFGKSYTHKIPVSEVIAERIWNTVFLALITLILTYLLAIPMGIASGRFNDTWIDKVVTGYNYLGFATPIFIFALIMLFVFGFSLGWFPTGGSVDSKVDAGTFAYYLSKLHHVILPALSTALIATVGTVQYLRNEIIDNKYKDYARTARSKGIPETQIYTRHIFRNSLLPIAAFLGYEITGLVGGTVIIETIFSYPGVGQLFVSSIGLRDFSVVTAIVMMLGFATLLGTLLSDIILSVVDPRIRIE
ncbi:oligopeptide ABC transporter permease [Peribacillus huizhouensis]|uniref:Peptide/nickel transport system permease protein n=1 Tax=Peribacillus huizhouensis TaxID=1501239 RepID=A0ABR6CJ71_9BACI|nr:oligopeptide ABC transporter permease [Peribacillus huizhouensis]MBA9025094.1 peptide/nickel transport system permease protein [Peribacillus huizhouensis]